MDGAIAGDFPGAVQLQLDAFLAEDMGTTRPRVFDVVLCFM
jgi:hypothetical protein